MTFASPTYSVLIVEDNPDLLDMMQRTLPRSGPFIVTGAPDGITGLEQFMTIRPSCVIIDVKMPGLNGYQLVRAIRGDPESFMTPIIILTAMAQAEDQFAGWAAGADRYLLKPISNSDLANQILEVISLNDSERQLRMQTLAEIESSTSEKGNHDDAASRS